MALGGKGLGEKPGEANRSRGGLGGKKKKKKKKKEEKKNNWGL